jgi:hypothetical protein
LADLGERERDAVKTAAAAAAEQPEALPAAE